MLRLTLLTLAFLTFVNPVQAQTLPPEGVVFDDLRYAPQLYTGRPDLPGAAGTLFGENTWNGGLSERAWNFHHLDNACTLADHTSIEVTDTGEVVFRIEPHDQPTDVAYDCNQINPDIVFGLMERTGTWAVRVKLTDLEPLTPFTETFWLHSAHQAQANDEKYWVEVNYEWQNWFSLKSYDADVTNDRWWGSWEWPKVMGYAENAPVLPTQRKTYMSTAARVYEWNSSPFSLIGSEGGAPLRNPLLANTDANNFTCYRSSGVFARENLDGPACMRAITASPNQYAILLFRYDGRTLTYSLALPNPNGAGGLRMDRQLTIGRHFQRMLPIIGSKVAVVSPNRTAEMVLDWYFYSPNATLDVNQVLRLTRSFQAQGITRLNTTGRSLVAPDPTPWTADILPPTPSAGNPLEFVVQPTPRGANNHTVEWRTTNPCTNRTSDWVQGSFAYRPPAAQTCDTIQVEVRVDDFWRTDRPEWATACTRYTYASGRTSACG
ncbi:MAG: hypothetical protein RhofKO_13410 [Rhodothermales bacterium]